VRGRTTPARMGGKMNAMRRNIVWLALGLSAACGPGPLTREGAADLIAKSLNASETLQLATPKGCFALPRGTEVRSADVERDPQLARAPYLVSTLRRERELELVEFEFTETSADAAAPPAGCGQLWATQHATEAKGAGAGRLKLVLWTTVPSDKAMAAGLQPGQTFLYLRQTLIAVTKLETRNDGTVLAEYRWRWAPSYEGEHLGIQPSDAFAGRARFRNVGDGWRLAR
jgi:hypothetical protein